MIGQDPAPDGVLAGDVKVPEHADVIAFFGMAGECDPVLLAPPRELGVVSLFEADPHGPEIILSVLLRRRQRGIPQRRQMRREVIPEDSIDVLEDIARPRPHIALPAAPHQGGFIGEDAQDGGPEVAGEVGRELVIDELQKQGHRRRVQQVARRGLIFRRAVADIVQPANKAIDPAVDNRQPAAVRLGKQGDEILVGPQSKFNPSRQFHLGQPPAGKRRVGGDHLAGG